MLLRQVAPRYPMQARMSRIQGAVVLQGIIGKDGNLHDLQVVSGNPSLVPAALDAAKSGTISRATSMGNQSKLKLRSS